MSRTFVPAAGHDLFLPLYDPLWRLMGGERVRAAFIREAGLAAHERILDVGCGTGSLPVQIAQTMPGTRSGLLPCVISKSEVVTGSHSLPLGVPVTRQP